MTRIWGEGTFNPLQMGDLGKGQGRGRTQETRNGVQGGRSVG